MELLQSRGNLIENRKIPTEKLWSKQSFSSDITNFMIEMR